LVFAIDFCNKLLVLSTPNARKAPLSVLFSFQLKPVL